MRNNEGEIMDKLKIRIETEEYIYEEWHIAKKE